MTSHGLETSVLSDVVLPAALAVITLGMGLSLAPADFRRIGRMPRAVAAGLAGQWLALPLLALAVAFVFHRAGLASEALVLGLVLLACCPGGATSNLLTYLARADTALSVTLTSITSLASAIITPVVFLAATGLLFGSGTPVQVSLPSMAGLVVAIVVLPILLGMAARQRWPGLAARAERPFRIASSAILVLVVAGVILQNRASFLDLAARTVPMSLALVVLAFGAGYALARLASVGEASARAISIEVGFQNGTLGIALAITQLRSPEAALVPGFYSLVMFLVGGALAWRWARSAGRIPEEVPGGRTVWIDEGPRAGS